VKTILLNSLLTTLCVLPWATLPTLAENSLVPTAVADDGYQLVWEDGFDSDGPPDPNNWTYERGFVRNNELQWYQEENAVCRSGLLVIEGRRERVENPRYDPEARDWRRNREFAEYTSACILTRGKHSWKYGRFVMRARVDTRPGLWPAFWTLGSGRGWPACGEIDVMEYYAGTLLANVCWLGENRQSAWDTSRYPIARFGADWPQQFHLWQLDWDANTIKISVDNKLLNETPLDKAINHDRRHTQPFQEPHYLLLNLAIGGTQGGDPTATEFPARFEVDCVRVFQRVEPASSNEVAP
jgi:beta-glucanase (GH16 family)